MRRTAIVIAAWCSLSLHSHTALGAAGGTALVHIEKTINVVTGRWDRLPLNQAPITPEGALGDEVADEARFYRLRITQTDDGGGPISLRTNEVPVETLKLALETLANKPEGLWSGAALAPVCIPVYNPAINGGLSPAYVEFKVVQGGTNAPKPFRYGPPEEPNRDAGYILVSLTENDLPVPMFATEGITRVERLRRLAKSSTLRAVHFSEGLLVAETGQGEALASLGGIPTRIPDGILSTLGSNYTTVVVSNQVLLDVRPPPYSFGSFSNHAEYRADYLQGNVHRKLREFRGEFAKLIWDLRRGVEPPRVTLPANSNQLLFAAQEVRVAWVEDEAKARLQILAGGGLRVTTFGDGYTLLHIAFQDLTRRHFLLVVGNPAPSGGMHQTKSPEYSWYAGSWDDQKHYVQEDSLAGCCPSGASGCGPTAWAMFYGWWDDFGGVASLIAGRGTPMHNNLFVRDCITHVFDWTHTGCLQNGMGYTEPWNMCEGQQWAAHQGDNIDYSDGEGLPYWSPWARDLARHAIQSHERVAIVGTGFYEHYPLAYAYGYDSYWWGKVEYWKVNEGWDQDSPEWVNAASCWYGMDAHCYH